MLVRCAVAALALLAVSLGGCSAAPDSGIEGVATRGPVCGGPTRDPPDPSCADKPFGGKVALWTTDRSRMVLAFTTASDGTFNVSVAPGTYVVGNPSGDAYPQHPACSSDHDVVVLARQWTHVVVSCDTGIR